MPATAAQGLPERGMRVHLVKALRAGVAAEPAGLRQGLADALPDALLVLGQRPDIGRLRAGARSSHGRSMAEDSGIPRRGARATAGCLKAGGSAWPMR